MNWSKFSLLTQSRIRFRDTASSMPIEGPKRDEDDRWNSRNIWKLKKEDVPFCLTKELLSSYEHYQHGRKLFPMWKNY